MADRLGRFVERLTESLAINDPASDHTDACLCGVAVALHFDLHNRKLSCDVARARLFTGAADALNVFGLPAVAPVVAPHTAPARLIPFPPARTS